MYKSQLFISFVLFLSVISLKSQDILKEAFELNKNGQFSESALLYEAQIQKSGPSADLYYNLGTVYLNDNRIAEARMALEKAILLSPGNKQVKKQLEFLKQRIEPQIEALPAILPYQWFISLRNLSSPSGWGYLMIFLAYSILVWVIAGSKSKIFKPVAIGLTLVLVISGLFYISGRSLQKEEFYILMQDNPLTIAPDSSSKVLIPLGKGIKTEVIDSLGSWYKVSLENNDQGWLPKAYLKNL